MKTIYLDNRILNVLKEEKIKKDIPDKLLLLINSNKTPFGKNGAFPDVYDDNFLEIILRKRYDEIKSKLLEIESIPNISSTDTNNALAKIIERCKEKERPYRDILEKICLNHVVQFFDIPKDSVEIEVNLCDEVKINWSSISFDKVKGMENYDAIEDIENFNAEVHKRQILNALSVGYAMVISSEIDKYIEEINKIDSELCELYKYFLLLNEYTLYTNTEDLMSEKDAKQRGISELIISQVDEKPVLKIQGEIFPILLCETIKCMMDLFASHGLPNDLNTAKKILKTTDYIKAEPWYMRVGPLLWLLMKKSGEKINSNVMPYLYSSISKLDVDNFNMFLKNVFAKTNKGKKLFSILIDKAKKEQENDSHKSTIDVGDMNNYLITDNYISQEEL